LHVHSTWHLRQQVKTGKPTKWCQLVKILSILKFSFTPYNGVLRESQFLINSISLKLVKRFKPLYQQKTLFAGLLAFLMTVVARIWHLTVGQ
jgi:hypothetical protein